MGSETEVLIIGGGPAGLAAAIAARKKGFEVTVVDGAKPPIDKACGEGLMPNTISALRELGIEIDARDGRVFRGLRFLDANSEAEANFPGTPGIGIRRTALHQKMLERAQQCAVSLLWNTPVSGLSCGGAIVGGRRMKAKWVIGADGIHSRVRRWSELESHTEQEARFALRRHYRVRPWTDCVEIYWGQRMQAYVTPLGNEETCVVVVATEPRVGFAESLREFPGLAARLADAELSSAERGGFTVTRRLSRVHRGNVALTGDASGSVDAITGEGLCLSFRQAIELADALEAQNLESYQSAHRRLLRWPNFMSRLLLLLGRNVQLRRRTLRVLAKDPGLFASLLSVHAGDGSALQLSATGLHFGYQFLTA
jgi:2-polyprenyl-6-methoxyphenol hydroxylase-like FAD-dependent oxidoreductase